MSKKYIWEGILIGTFIIMISFIACLSFDIALLNELTQGEPICYAEGFVDDEILKHYREPVLEDDFEDDVVSVIFKHEFEGEIGFENLDKYTELSDTIISIEHKLKTIYKGKDKKIFVGNDRNPMARVHLSMHSKQTVIDIAKQLMSWDKVLVAGPVYKYEIANCNIPNDSLYSSQWGLKTGYGIRAEDAWGIVRGSESVSVGIMESCAYTQHEDLYGNFLNGNNSFDFFRDVTDDNKDDICHGTHVAGIVGAKQNYNGIAGLADVKMYLLSPSYFFYSLQYAENNNIKIINASFYFTDNQRNPAPYDPDCYTAISNYDGLLVCGAGNDGIDTDITPRYPASYNLPNVISVGAINENGGRCSWSNYGATTVNLFAPGDHILSTFPTGFCCDGICNPANHYSDGYHYMSGTSMAAPFVTGVAALCLSANPNLTPAQLKNIILGSATPETSLNGICVSGGRLNAYEAVKAAAFQTNAAGDTITGVNCQIAASDFSIPDKINGYAITTIGNNAFKEQNNLRCVTLPSRIKEIGNCAFQDCANLETVNMISSTVPMPTPKVVLSTSNNYYYEQCTNQNLSADTAYRLTFRCNARSNTGNIFSVNAYLGVGNTAMSTIIAEGSFSSNVIMQEMAFSPSLSQLYPSSKLWIRFEATNPAAGLKVDITDINLEKGVSDIAIDAFRGCGKLRSQGLEFTPVYKYNHENIDHYYVSQSQNSTIGTALFIPSEYNGKPVKQITASGFYGNKNIKWVFMQQGLETIGNRAFQYCSNLLKVDMIQTSVTKINDYTFDVCEKCHDSNHIHNPRSQYSGYCSINEITYPADLTTIGEGAFIRTGIPYNSPLPDTVTSIGAYAFYDSKMLLFHFPTGLASLGAYALSCCGAMITDGFENVNLETIKEGTFEMTQLSNVHYLPASIKTIEKDAFSNSGFYADFHFLGNNIIETIGEEAFYGCGLKSIILKSTIEEIGERAFWGNNNLTIYTQVTSKPNGWHTDWNYSNRPVFWECTLSSDKTHVLSFKKKAGNPSNISAVNGISNPCWDGYNFSGWYILDENNNKVYYSDLSTIANGKTVYADWTKQSCVAEGTLITLADGTQVAVEDLTGNENLLVWNMLTGEYDSAPILFIDSDPSMAYEIIELTFSDGTEVKVIDEHAFFDMTLGEYIFLRSDAAQYIGHYFN